MTTLLAFDTATERLTIALRQGDRTWSHAGEGGAKASATLVPAILALLHEAGLTLADLDAIAFGRGPGAFTGLRTACSVAQGLAFGADKPVLPIDSLLAVAEHARVCAGAADFRVWVAIDARMDQIYAADYAYAGGGWTTQVPPMLTDCEALSARWHAAPPQAIAGDAVRVFSARLVTADALLFPQARPEATAMLALAEAAWRAGEAVDAALALPLYVRDKVAETTAERATRALEKG